MKEKQILPVNSSKHAGMTRREFLPKIGLALAGSVVAAKVIHNFSRWFGAGDNTSGQLHAASLAGQPQDGKKATITEVFNATIDGNGNFRPPRADGVTYPIGEKILNEVTKNGKWGYTQVYLVNNDLYVIAFKYGVVVISDRDAIRTHKALDAEIGSFAVLEPEKGELAKLLVDGKAISVVSERNASMDKLLILK